MKVVLREEVKHVGRRGDIVDVADGYARNFLIPQGKALKASNGVEAQADAMRRAWSQKNAKDREAAEEIATKVVSNPITIAARASADGKLFGSVTAADIVAALAEQTGVELDRKMVTDEHLKELGTHTVTATPHAEVQFPITIEVVAA
ncbi:MAG: 50S ribosomal protein L9 [Acidimicrobiales bacterium]|nr:50S ribosomal protein L9 [Acidimicrobiales bacterium]